MATLTDFLTSREVFIVILIAIAVSCIGTIYFVVEKVYRNKKEKKLAETSSNRLVKVSDNRIEIAPVLDQIITEAKKVEEKKETVPAIEPDKEVENCVQVIPVVEEEVPKIEIKEVKEEVAPTVENIFQEVKDKVETDKQSSEITYAEIEPTPEEAKEEIRKATEELLKTQELQRQEMIDLTKFEQEQEENAIISLDELYNKSKTLYEQNEITQYEDEGDEPISLADLEARMNRIKIEASELEKDDKEEVVVKQENEVNEDPRKVVKLDDFNTVDIKDAYNEDKIFKSSPIISPIFGIEKQVTTNDMELENTANYEKLDEEIKKTNEFLRSLKELQKKLE